MEQSSVSLIIPALNEEKTIGGVIRETAEIMDRYGLPYEIIVVNDGSTDNTELAALSTRKAIVLSNMVNRGKGYCLRQALKLAKGTIIVTLDADGEHKPKEIPRLITPLLEGIDVVSGSRFLESRHNVTSRINKVGNLLFNASITLLTGRLITDSQTGFRAMRKDFADKLKLKSDGYEVETEIAVKSLINGFKVKEVPITIDRRKYSSSKLKIVSDGRKIFATILESGLSTIEH